MGGNLWASTAVAAAPIAILFFLIGVRRLAAWKAVIVALVTAALVRAVRFGAPDKDYRGFFSPRGGIRTVSDLLDRISGHTTGNAMKVNLAYGREGLTVDVPECSRVVRARFTPSLADEVAAIRDAIRKPIQTAPLAEKVRPNDRVVIVHTDITRATPNDRVLPVLLSELESAGVKRENITLLNALGTHRRQTDGELRQMLGADIVDRYRSIQHDANDDANLVSLGQTSRGHPVRVNRRYLEADVRILTGLIEPHFFAGFSGGPKGVLPSIAGAESVHSNHGYDMIAHPKATWGVTVGNPIWEEMREVALRTNPTFLLNVAINAAGQITGVFAGDMLAAHAAGCRFVKEHAIVPVAEPFDIVHHHQRRLSARPESLPIRERHERRQSDCAHGRRDHHCGRVLGRAARSRPICRVARRGRFAARRARHVGPARLQRAGPMGGANPGQRSTQSRRPRPQRRAERRADPPRTAQTVHNIERHHHRD